MSLEGRVALVTGSGRNIGRTVALSLAKEGAAVVVNARTNKREAEAVAAEARALGVKALPVLADVGDRCQLENLLEQALGEFGRIDIVVNNASVRPHRALKFGRQVRIPAMQAGLTKRQLTFRDIFSATPIVLIFRKAPVVFVYFSRFVSANNSPMPVAA